MVRTAVTLGRIPMAREKDLRTQLRGAGNSRLEGVNFKPQEHAISRRDVWVADRAVVMLQIPRCS